MTPQQATLAPHLHLLPWLLTGGTGKTMGRATHWLSGHQPPGHRAGKAGWGEVGLRRKMDRSHLSSRKVSPYLVGRERTCWSRNFYDQVLIFKDTWWRYREWTAAVIGKAGKPAWTLLWKSSGSGGCVKAEAGRLDKGWGGGSADRTVYRRWGGSVTSGSGIQEDIGEEDTGEAFLRD